MSKGKNEQHNSKKEISVKPCAQQKASIDQLIGSEKYLVFSGRKYM